MPTTAHQEWFLNQKYFNLITIIVILLTEGCSKHFEHLTLSDRGERIGWVWPKFNFRIRRDHEKNLLWVPRLWVRRRWGSILGYISKIDEKKDSGHKELILYWISLISSRYLRYALIVWRLIDSALLEFFSMIASYSKI